MDIPRLGKFEPIKLTGWHLIVGALLPIVVLGGVSLQAWGDSMVFPKLADKGVPQDKRLSFDVSLGLQEALENGVISEGLRQEFNNHGVALTDNARAFTIDQGSRWLITDESKSYDINTGRGTGLAVAQQFSFGSSLEFQRTLENGVVSEGLKQDFANNGVALSENARVSTIGAGNQWRITDGSDIYDLKVEEDRLNIDQRIMANREVFIGDPIARGVDTATDWVTTKGDFIFDRVSDLIDDVLTWLTDSLLWLPWPVLIAAVALLAWRLAGLSVGVFSVGALLMIGFSGLWPSAMETVALVVTAVTISIAIAMPLAILAARSNTVDTALRPLLDGMQTMPSFVYLVPAIFFFGLGNPPAVMATIVYAVPPVIRLTNLGIRQVPSESVEAARAFGASPMQLLRKVQLPLALPTIMAGINQTTMMALAMVVVASLVGAGGLGEDVLRAIGQLHIGDSLLAGLAIVFLAIIIDRITQGVARAQAVATAE